MHFKSVEKLFLTGESSAKNYKFIFDQRLSDVTSPNLFHPIQYCIRDNKIYARISARAYYTVVFAV